LDRVIDLTGRLKQDGTLDWQIPAGKWTVMRFVRRNNGSSTRPATQPGIGFECDKFDAAALDAHFDDYIGILLAKVGTRKRESGWTMLHIDSWEMGAQNWTPKWREEFMKRRGYDPQPYYPAYLGYIVGSREQTERFLWDLRKTGSELVVENHVERLKTLGRRHGFTLSIEPYDMNPSCDFDLGAVADIPMCEFWSHGFDTAFSCLQAGSIADIMGRPVVAAEAFTANRGEDWKFHPGSLKNQTGSVHESSAVDFEGLSGDEAGRGRGQKEDRLRDLFRPAEAPHGCRGTNRFQHGGGGKNTVVVGIHCAG
jgi:hypothetical protein